MPFTLIIKYGLTLMTQHILIIEDNAKVASVLIRLLQAKGYQITHIDHGNDVLPWLLINKTDLILLDVMLPGKTGIELCALIREDYLVPIIMLTAMKSESDQITGLEQGANDYITKPFNIHNVLARIKTNLRYSQQLKAKTHEQKSAFIINERNIEAQLHGNKLSLTLSEFRLLNTFHNNQGQLFSRQDLLNIIYDDYRVVSDRTIDTHIKSLRKKLAQHDEFEFIESVYSKGYKFNISS